MKTGKPWTDEEAKRVAILRDRGTPWSEVAKKLDRPSIATSHSVQQNALARASALGSARKTPFVKVKPIVKVKPMASTKTKRYEVLYKIPSDALAHEVADRIKRIEAELAELRA